MRALVAGFVAALGLWLAAAPVLASGTRGITVELRDAGAPEQMRLYGASHALVIGIDAYTAGWQRLSKAVEDARAVAGELERQGFAVTLRTDLSALELQQALKEFFALKGADPEARLLVWFAGHGHTLGGEGFIVPADAPLPNDPAFKIKALPLRDFGSLVRLAEAKHVLSVFDSCFSGTVFQARAGGTPPAITRKTAKPVRQFITSGDAGQQVRDDGSFREYFLRALRGDETADFNGDGYVTGEELGLFLQQEMAALTQAAQTPRHGKLHDVKYNEGDFVFALPKGAGAASPPKASPPAASGEDREALFWASVKDSTDPALFRAYLERWPGGTFAAIAESRIRALAQPKAAAPSAPATAVARPSPRLWEGRDAENVLVMDLPTGRVVIEMRPDLAPRHVARIKELVRKGFYDGTPFHRVIDGFMAQGGDPTGTGTGGSGVKLAAEFSSQPHVRGVVSMARAAALDSADSQFFIMYAPAPFLDGKYTVWGRVVSGMEHIDRLPKGASSGIVANPDRIQRLRVAADIKE